MRIGVSNAQSEVAHGSPHGGLQCVIDRIRLVLDARDVPVSYVRTRGVRIVAARNAQVDRSCSRDRWPAWPCRERAAVACVDDIAQVVVNLRRNGQSHAQVRIVSGRNWQNLVDVALLRQVRALASDIGNSGYNVARELLLHVEMPL